MIHPGRTALIILSAAAAASIALTAAPAQNQALPKPRTFKPPRIAVLEAHRLFEN